MRTTRAVWVALGLVGGLILVGWIAGNRVDAGNDGSSTLRQWTKGKGWGWVWGAGDEVGALNEMTNATRLAALSIPKSGRVYDLGVPYARDSYKFPGHSPGEVISFRSPGGIKQQRDVGGFVDPAVNPAQLAWHSAALFISDNVGTQIDGLAHITTGSDDHWYNGFREAEWGGDFGVRKCGGETIPPIIARGVMLDVAGLKGVDALPAHYPISVEDVEAAAARQKVELRPGDVVLVRTGTLRYWGKEGADHAKIAAHDSAGISLTTAKYLVEQKGAMMLGSDTSGLECNPPAGEASSPIPVHEYLLIDQGVHIAEFHDLEQLAKDRVYEFCYIALVNKVLGAAAGFAMRPIAID